MYPAGRAGMALYSYKLANALAGKGVRVTLFVDDHYELDNLPFKFKKVKALSSRNDTIGLNKNRIVTIANIIGAHLYNLHKFYCYVKKNRPEIVHIQSLFYLADWYILSHIKRTKAMLVLTVHDVIPHKFYTKRFRWLELVILQYMYNKADKLIVHAERNRRQLLANFSVDVHKVIVIPHGEYSLYGISQEVSENEVRSILNLNYNQKIILFFGYIRKIKGIDVLLKSFDKVAELFPNVMLIIAGPVIQGESFSEYREVMSHMRFRNRVKFLIKYVKHKDVAIFFKCADIVVLPYLEFYSQSGVLYLAQGFGKAVIVTDVGGMPEVVKNEETGLVVPPGDVDRLVEAMGYLLENEELRKKMGQRARELAMERFSWDAIAKATIEKVYSG